MSDSILRRALRVVDAVSAAPEGLRHKEIKALLGAPSPSTVSKILHELVGADVLAKTPQGAYVVGMKAYFWGKNVAARRGPLQTIREEMQDLRERFEASVNLFTLSGRSMLCLEGYTSERSTVLWPAGKSLPLALPVIGAMFFIDPGLMRSGEYLEELCAAHRPRLDPARVSALYEETMATDLMLDPGIFYPGILRAAVPIRERGEVAMVLGVGVMESQHEDETDILATLGEALSAARERIDEDMRT